MKMKLLASLKYVFLPYLDSLPSVICGQIAKYTISAYGRIIVTPPLQDLPRSGYGVSSSVFWTLFPNVRKLQLFLFVSKPNWIT